MTMIADNQKFQEIISSEFVLYESHRSDMLNFRSKKANHHAFALFHESLTEYEILEVAKILVEVYGSISVDISKTAGPDEEELTTINLPDATCRDYVRAVIELDASALHKFLLLGYSRWIYSEARSEDFIKLAKTKIDLNLDPDEVFASDRLFEFLKDLYIFPGVDQDSILKSRRNIQLGRNSAQLFAQVMAFSSNCLENVALGEHLDLPLSEGISTQKSFSEFASPNSICKLIDSRYKDLARSMTFSEVNSLWQILDWKMQEGYFPYSMLLNRCKVMDNELAPLNMFEYDSVGRYLSKEQRNSLSSGNLIENLDSLLKNNSHNRGSRTPSVIYAAIAEILFLKGERKALEVAGCLEHLRFTEGNDVEKYEATVAIIMLALEKETEEFPFGWIAQFSEHAWVLQSRNNSSELSNV